MRRRHRAALGIGLLFVALSVWQLLAAARGLQIRRVSTISQPATVITPTGARDRPVVLVAHGIAGSDIIMRGFGLTLAHAGYTAVLWSFDGHGDNPRPLTHDSQGDALMRNAETALAGAVAAGYGDRSRVAVLGHSMGSGVALAYGQEHPETAATIAVSPTGQEVTLKLPRNLLLMAGSLEGRFVENAEERLAEAGGAGGNPAEGTARKLVVVPNVEHISILMAPAAHAEARDWLDATFGSQPGAMDYVDQRLMWYGVGLLGTMILALALAPLTAGTTFAVEREPPALWRRLGALVTAAAGATLLLWLASKAGLELGSFLNLVVGGYLLIWFGLAGLLALVLLRVRPSRLWRRALWGGLLVFAALWLGVGLMGQFVWLPWLLIPRRLLLWPLGVVLLLPWFLAVGEASEKAGTVGKAGWWLAHSAVLLAAMVLALQLNPELGFLILILPLFPAILGLHALACAPQRGSWPFALSGALFTSWLLLAVFPVL
jgi:dienelactone hydrolase